MLTESAPSFLSYTTLNKILPWMGWLCAVAVFRLIKCSDSLQDLHCRPFLNNNNDNNNIKNKFEWKTTGTKLYQNWNTIGIQHLISHCHKRNNVIYTCSEQIWSSAFGTLELKNSKSRTPNFGTSKFWNFKILEVLLIDVLV